MKELIITIWLLIISLDVIRNLNIICVRYQTPVYWKTTALRSIIALIVCIVFAGSVVQFIQIGIALWCTYSLPFDALLNLSRNKKLLHMGEKSLPERLLAGKHLMYFCLKVWLFVTGICILYYQEILRTIPN